MDKQTTKFDDDDGRVICDMDVEGMRWHDKRKRHDENVKRRAISHDQMTQFEARQYTWHAVLAALLMVSVFSITWVLFILFCTQIWFR